MFSVPSDTYTDANMVRPATVTQTTNTSNNEEKNEDRLDHAYSNRPNCNASRSSTTTFVTTTKESLCVSATVETNNFKPLVETSSVVSSSVSQSNNENIDHPLTDFRRALQERQFQTAINMLPDLDEYIDGQLLLEVLDAPRKACEIAFVNLIGRIVQLHKINIDNIYLRSLTQEQLHLLAISLIPVYRQEERTIIDILDMLFHNNPNGFIDLEHLLHFIASQDEFIQRGFIEFLNEQELIDSNTLVYARYSGRAEYLNVLKFAKLYNYKIIGKTLRNLAPKSAKNLWGFWK